MEMENDENPFPGMGDIFEDDNGAVEKKRKREIRLEEEKRKRRKLEQERGFGKVYVGGSQRRKGYAKPLDKSFIVAPIISMGPKKWKGLSPFFLGPIKIKTNRGKMRCHNFENLWQFSKVHPRVARQTGKKWKHESEEHCRLKPGTDKDDFSNYEILEKYYSWRKKGFGHDLAIRRPNGTVRKNGPPVFSLHPETNERMDYITSRKKLYEPYYISLATKRKEFKMLLEFLKKGDNILLIDVDGPNIDDFPNGREMSLELCEELINDSKKIYGHGFACAKALLLELEKEPKSEVIVN